MELLHFASLPVALEADSSSSGFLKAKEIPARDRKAVLKNGRQHASEKMPRK